MDAAGIPTKIGTIWAASASTPYVNVVPVPSQQAIANGRASFTDGFPPNCFIPYSSGGAGPFGGDSNGILQLYSQWLQWSQAGGPIKWDSAFATAIGGYPNGAIIQSATTAGLFWRCTADNNTSNPDTGGSNWVVFTTPLATVAGDTVIANATGGTAVPTAIPVGNGLQFSGGTLRAAISSGLAFSGGTVAAQIGPGLTFSGNSIVVNPGFGLGFSGSTLVATGYSESFGTHGYQILPSGLILQWGTEVLTTTTNIIYPISFPNQVFSVQITDFDASSWSPSNLTFYGANNSGLGFFELVFANWNGSGFQLTGGVTASWLAIGH